MYSLNTTIKIINKGGVLIPQRIKSSYWCWSMFSSIQVDEKILIKFRRHQQQN
jgi:hypothetical protein